MANQPAAQPLTPTFQGFISSTMDALILFEACFNGTLLHVPRRPHDRERGDLIRSGNVFIYEEHSSGIKRWTDGVPWSPSRILGNFLVYRELDKPFQPGEKKRAMKRNKTDGVSKNAHTPRTSSITGLGPGAATSSQAMAGMESVQNGNDSERAFVGSLVDSYQFREHGLIKKTISVVCGGVQHHLVSYYNLEDVKGPHLKRVTDSLELQGIRPRRELLTSGTFRAPVDDSEFSVIDTSSMGGHLYIGPGMGAYTPGPVRSLSIPATQPYGQGQNWVASQQYGHDSAYLPQTMQPPTTGYNQQLCYPYDSAYATSSRQPVYGPVASVPRRHSVVSNTNGTSQLGYTTGTNALAINGTGLAAHNMSSESFLNGDIFGTSAAHAIAHSAPLGQATVYSPASTMAQSHSSHTMGMSGPHHAIGLDGQLSNEYEQAISRTAIDDFGSSIQDSTDPNFGPTGDSMTPTDLPLGMDNSESAAESEWEKSIPDVEHSNAW